MDAVPNDIITYILSFLLQDAEDVRSLSLVSKKFNENITNAAKENCLEWWNNILKFKGNHDLSTKWPLSNLVYPILQEEFSTNWKSLLVPLQTKINVWGFEGSNLWSVIGHEKSSTFLRIGQIYLQHWPPDPPGWYWSGPHIKIFRIRAGSGFQYQILITHHSDEELAQRKGTIILENGVLVKGMIASGTTRANDDGFEYLFFSVPQQIIKNNQVLKIEEQNHCSECDFVMFRCCGCQINFCFYCSQIHNIDNCSMPAHKWDLWMSREMSGMSAWDVVENNGEIKCGEKFARARNKLQTPQSYYGIDFYYDSESDEK